MIQDVTIEVLPDEAGHLRAASNDQKIPDRCDLLRQVTGNPEIMGEQRGRLTPLGIAVRELD
jgi:hypothetical protein